MLSVKQGGIKYHFLSLWYDSTWDWTQVSRVFVYTFSCKSFETSLSTFFTQLNGFKYYYVTKNSIKHQSFVYIQLNDQTFLFLTL